MAGPVVEFRPSRKFAGEVSRKRRPRKKPSVASSKDPRIKIAGRTFEITRVYVTSDTIIERRIRVRIVGKGGLEDEVFNAGGRNCYVGLVSEQLEGRDKWSPYTWGHVPVEGTDWVREIVNEAPIKAHKKDETDG